jgi:hypothetical protein
MKMIYILELLGVISPCIDRETAAAWRRDPLSHPALMNMSERELADLPLGKPRFAARSGEAVRCRS